MSQLIETYLQDHHAADVAALEVFDRIAEGHSDPHVREAAAQAGEQFRQDHATLETLMGDLGTSTSMVKDTAANLAEKLGRFKPNDRIISRSPLSDLDELEGLVLAVHARVLLLAALIRVPEDQLAPGSAGLHHQLQELIDRATDQEDRLEQLRLTQVAVLTQD